MKRFRWGNPAPILMAVVATATSWTQVSYRGEIVPPEVVAEVRQAAKAAFAAQEWKEAERLFTRLVVTNDTDADSQYHLGVSRIRLSEYKTAEAPLLRSLALKFNVADTNFFLAGVYAQMERTSLAMKYLEAAVIAGFDDLKEASTEPSLEPIRDSAGFRSLLHRIEFPALNLPGGDALEFWVGEWDYFTANGKRGGWTVVVREAKGFALREGWTNIDGSRGTSLYTFLAAEKKWKQIWTSDAGWITEKIGTPVKGGIRFEGSSTYPDGTKTMDRESLMILGKDRVRQVIEQSADGGKSWTEVADGTFIRRRPATAPVARSTGG